MLTAHWDSVAQHEECIASDLNREAIGAIGLHMDPSQLKVTHVQDVRMFPAEMLREEEEEASLLSVVRLLVRNNGDGDGDGVVSESESINNNKARVERIWTSRAKHMLADAAGGLGRYHVAGWRVERDDDQGGEEFVIVGPWASAGPLDDFVNGTWKYAHAWAEVWGDVVSEPDIKTYIRI
ncbi:hypothetical protein F5Y17DRAFT_417283 [Xylariaceae sp. FL0594]|nr:hypothetical protein F5Y17DRAFT_417283 [Xylariaceae sp. FL0594]